MNLNLLKIFLTITFIILFTTVYLITKHDLKLRKNTVLSQEIENLSNTYKVSMNRFEIVADSINSTVINRKEVLELLHKAKHADSTEALVPLRKELFAIIKPHFDNLKKIGVIITLFTFENNKTFLRVHKPSKFNDDLSKVRYSFKYVNENKKIIRGLEEGKIMHAFRNIYPIFYNNTYLGSVDIAFSSSVLRKHMENLYDTESHFIINKNIFITNIWKMKEMVNYVPSIEHEDFLQDNDKHIHEMEIKLNKKLKKEIYENIKHTQPFSLEDSGQIISFLPVKDIKDKKTIAYLVSYKDSDYVKNLIKENILTNLLFFIVLIVIHIVIYLGVSNRLKYKKVKNQEVQDYLNIAKVLIMALDNNKNVIMINEEGAKLLGYTKDEIIGKNWIDNFLPKDTQLEVDHIASDIIDFKDTHSGHENYVLTKSGELKLISWKNATLFDTEGNATGILTSGEDITERKRISLELQRSKLNAEQANQVKSNFLASMSHEIRTPMTGLLGFIERLRNTEKDPERLKQFDVIKNSGQTLLAIINDILDFSKIESGKVELDSSPYSIQNLFSSSLDVYASLASRKGISLHSMIDENLPICLLGDETRLKQIVFNLLSNAIKFTSNNGKVTLNARYNDVKQTVYIAVIDTGIGISKDNLKKIFGAFSQEDTSTTRKYGGTGLGLSISSSLVKLMDSELRVESTVGEGSKFYFEIPVEVCLEDTINDSMEANEEMFETVDLKGHILVVEDNKTNQMLMSMILDDLGLTYDIANDGAEGVLNFKLNQYDAILMDENMPIMNGVEATQNIREMEADNSLPSIIIIAVTANALTGDKEKFLEAGMNDYIPKPYSEEDIVKVLQKYLS